MVHCCSARAKRAPRREGGRRPVSHLLHLLCFSFEASRYFSRDLFPGHHFGQLELKRVRRARG